MTRSIESFIPLVMMVFAAIVLGRALAASSDRALRKSVVFSFWVLLIVLILQVLHLQPRPSAFPKSTFPFTETSHFVLAFTPVLMFICVSAARRRSLAWLLLGFSLGVFVQSLALIMGCMIMTVASRRLLLVTLAVIAVMAAGLPFGKEYFATRLDFTGAALNLSNLVYIQGWELIPESFLRSSGWGVGFQQLGFHGTNVPAATLIHAITDGDEANLTDGSFVFSKLASEFGVAGVFLGFLYLYGAFRSIRALRRGADRATIRFAHCVVAAYGVDMFVRGTGYFVESTFLFLAAVSALSYNVEDRWLAVTRSLLLGRPRQPST
jgi:hypothetical protein